MIDEKLETVLRGHLPAASPDEPLKVDDSLIELGIDSLKLVEFIIDLEDSYQIQIPDEEMLAENFTTVGNVSTLVSRILSANGTH